MDRWLGIDVGGKRKRFDIALINDRRVLALAGHLSREEVIELVETERPSVVAIDSPRTGCPRSSPSLLRRLVSNERQSPTPGACLIGSTCAFHRMIRCFSVIRLPARPLMKLAAITMNAPGRNYANYRDQLMEIDKRLGVQTQAFLDEARASFGLRLTRGDAQT